MGFLTRAFEQRDVSVVGEALWRSWKAQGTTAGVNVTPETALTFSAVFAAHKILAESTAMLPLFLLKRLAGGGKEPATQKRLYSVLHDVANPEMDAYLVRETMTAHLASWGRAHAKIDYDANGDVVALWPIHPKRVTVKRNPQKALYFEVSLPNGGTQNYRWDEMLYLRGMSPDGINVYTPISLQKQGIGLGLAAEAFGAALFDNGATPKGVLTSPTSLSDKAYERLKLNWNNEHQGISNANKIALLEEGVKWEDTSIPPDDAQFLQTRQFQVEEIARWYRIPPPMLALAEKAMTYASVEAFGLQFVTYTLFPWLVRWEKGISMQLLLERERSKYFAEHLMTALLRGDTAARNQSYATGRQWGWLSVNDIRTMENMNPIDGGDVYLTPANMLNSADPNTIQKKMLPVFTEAMQRIVRREANDIRGAIQKILVKKGAEEFTDWMGTFYQEHQEFIVRSLMSAAQSYAEMICDGTDMETVTGRVTESLKLFALRRAAAAQEQFKTALLEADPAHRIESILEGWDATYAERGARLQLSQQTAALVKPAKEPEWAIN